MGLSAEQKVGLSDEELEALDDVEEGGYVDGDEDEDEGDAPVTAAPDPDPDDGEGGAPVEDVPAAAQADAAAAPAGEPDPVATADTGLSLQPPPAALITVPEIGDYEAERGRLLDERRDLRQKHRDGDLSSDEYEEQLDQLNDKLSLVDRRKADHDHAVEQNAAVQRAQYQWTIEQVKKDFARVDKIDYDANPVLMTMWDKNVRDLAAKEENASKPAEWFLREGHKLVMSEVAKVAEALGFSKGEKPKVEAKVETKESVKDAVASRVPAVPLKGVGQLPAAASETISGDEFSDLEGLSGLELERALARMPEERAAKYLLA